MRTLGTAATCLVLSCLVSASAFAQAGGAPQVTVYWGTSGMFGPFDITGLVPRRSRRRRHGR